MRHFHKNPRQITKTQMSDLKASMEQLGDLSGITHDLDTDELLTGNQRCEALPGVMSGLIQPEITQKFDPPLEDGTALLGYFLVDGRMFNYRAVRGWDNKKRDLANLRANKMGGFWDWDIMANEFDVETLLDSGWTDEELTGADFGEEQEAPEPQLNRAEELRERWGVELGQLWQIGEHRILCGDCTDAAVVDRLMGGEKAVLLHADPPYGMGKENEGIENDNLYREKLDAFQMKWWHACRSAIENNGSVYIWGKPDDLYRLWYLGGLRDSERLTFRNEIVWGKGYGQGMESDRHRMYPTTSERCLFFMLGEQGFNNNADNYWNAWDSIREYLEEQRDLMGWSIEDTKRIAGHSPTSGCHWFDRSQWSMPTEEVYNAWQQAAKGDGFKKDYDELKKDYDELKKEYDELKKDFYSTRAYFDNTHDLMTDVWRFNRVVGDDRHGHATPKPVEMMERIILSSSRKGDTELVPFLGTGPELVACERLNRKGRGIEISPNYVAVCLQRLAEMNLEPKLID